MADALYNTDNNHSSSDTSKHALQTSATCPRVLSIAGTDPTGGAGIHADLKSITVAGGYAMGAVSALVAQNTCGVRHIEMTSSDSLQQQLNAVSDDVTIDALKIGMLGSTVTISIVQQWLKEHRPPIVVIDPVMVATSGDKLLDNDAEQALRNLLPFATVITPNIPELEVLAKLEPHSITNFKQACEISKRIAQEFHILVTVKGGHLDGHTINNAIIGENGIVAQSTSRKFNVPCTHGTGCSMSSALATRLAKGEDYQTALSWCTQWLEEAIYCGTNLHVGNGHGPIDHSYRLRSLTKQRLSPIWTSEQLDIQELEHVADAYDALNRLYPNYDFSRTEENVKIAPTGPWTELLWYASKPLVQEILALPFNIQLAHETLSAYDFTAYQRQDSYYLDAYSRALAQLASRGNNTEETLYFSNMSVGILQEKADLHNAWLNKHSSGELYEAAHEPISSITRGYTDFLMARAAYDPYPVALASSLPCPWLYGDIGVRYAKFDHPEHLYHDWLKTYSAPGIEDTITQWIDLVEKNLTIAQPKDRATAVKAFLTAMIWEREFFDQTHTCSYGVYTIQQ